MEAVLLASPWLVWAVFIPLIGALLAFLVPAGGPVLVPFAVLGTIGSVAGLVWQVIALGVQRHAVGGWTAPLGIDLYADGLSAAMLLTVALVGAGVSLYATRYFHRDHNAAHDFWPLWFFLWAALNALFVSRDIFNLYVTLELVGLAAVALVALAGGATALSGAMRYLLASLLGSLAYLLGVALIYGAYGTLDIGLLRDLVAPEPATWTATGLMVAGLLLKTALFPLHFWLPSAHASAPTPVSALLSALVVKASFYLLLRLWFGVFPLTTPAVGHLLGVLGALAIVWGSLQALRQSRLKLLVAYSTVAQLGYLFLAFPLALTPVAVTAWSGAMIFVLSHAMAKAAMFLAAGNILHFVGHDRIAELGRAPQRISLSWAAFGLAGISIMGLPPTAGFGAKWLLLNAALASGQWWWSIPIVGGGLLAAAYVFRAVACTFASDGSAPGDEGLPGRMEWAALGLSLGALVTGFAAPQFLLLLHSGDPFAHLAAEGAP